MKKVKVGDVIELGEDRQIQMLVSGEKKIIKADDKLVVLGGGIVEVQTGETKGSILPVKSLGLEVVGYNLKKLVKLVMNTIDKNTVEGLDVLFEDKEEREDIEELIIDVLSDYIQ